MSLVTKIRQQVKIVNAPSGWPSHWPHERCTRYIRNNPGLARFDHAGRLEFLLDAPTIARREIRLGTLANGPSLSIIEVDNFSGFDARPGRAVMPPSAEVLAKQSSRPSVFIPPAYEKQMPPQNQQPGCSVTTPPLREGPAKQNARPSTFIPPGEVLDRVAREKRMGSILDSMRRSRKAKREAVAQ